MNSNNGKYNQGVKAMKSYRMKVNPKKTDWPDGLPQVGDMVLSDNGSVFEVMLEVDSEGKYVLKCSKGQFSFSGLSALRPISNLNQIARDKAIDEMVNIAFGRGNKSPCEKLYDAGFRKFKPLPADWYADCLDGDMELNDYLIDCGYCIGEEL